jgi:type III pantothenate kinase
MIETSEDFFTFDIGNSHPHVGIFKNGALSETLSWRKFISQHVDKNTKNSLKGIASIVGAKPEGLKKIEDQLIHVPALKEGRFLDMPVNYTETLGKDRLYQAYKIYKMALKNPNRNYALIDAGTFITLDLINSDGLQGGHILPGVSTFLASYRKGQDLPALDESTVDTTPVGLPSSTQGAIMGGLKLYLSSCLKEFLESQKIDHCLITGGSSDFILGQFPAKRQYHVEIIPHLIHQSLFELAFQLDQGEKI